MAYVTVKYSRESLYEEVWSEPVTKVAKRYDVSDVAIRKICVKLRVPLPPRGYWARLAAGRPARKPALPKFDGPGEIVRHRAVRDEAGPQVREEPPHLLARREFEALPENRIVVAEQLVDPHRLVRRIRLAMRGRHARDQRDWPRANGVQGIDVAVSADSVDRALRILDAFIKALAKRGVNFSPGGEQGERTCITMQGEALGIRLAEKSIRSERPPNAEERAYMKRTGLTWYPNRFAYAATGTLSLVCTADFGIAASASDGKTQRLEDRLNELVVSIEEAAMRAKQRREEIEAQNREWERQAEIRRKKEWARGEEMEKIKKLEQEASEWRRAENIRAYVASVEAAPGAESAPIPAEGDLGRWIAWARSRADWLDPRIRARCPILDG